MSRENERLPAPRHGILFVCLGNICRSPLAEAIFLEQARQRDSLLLFDVDSCGTGGWHAGEGADPRSIAVAMKHGIHIDHTARQLDIRVDAARYATIVAMDRTNLRDIQAAAKSVGMAPPPIRLMLDYLPDAVPGAGVPDPYYGGDEGFQRVFDMLNAACAGLLCNVLDTKK